MPPARTRKHCDARPRFWPPQRLALRFRPPAHWPLRVRPSAPACPTPARWPRRVRPPRRWPLRRLATAPVGHWTGWPLDRLATGPVGHWTGWPLDRLATGPVGHWTGWPLDRLATGPVGPAPLAANDDTIGAVNGFATKAAATAHAQSLESDQRHGTCIDPAAGKTTLREWSVDWLDALDVAVRTEDFYRSLLHPPHPAPLGGPRRWPTSPGSKPPPGPNNSAPRATPRGTVAGDR